jgi:hypothetical protein
MIFEGLNMAISYLSEILERLFEILNWFHPHYWFLLNESPDPESRSCRPDSSEGV